MTFIQNANAGALAGVFTTAVMVPGERIKCLLQVQQAGSAPSGVHYNGPLDVVKKLYKQGGIASIYRGTGATLLRDIPASAAYLSVYEYLKKKLSGEGAQRTLSPGATLLAGGLAGIANWGVCIPADVLKSRLQTAPEGKYPDGIRGVFREIIREEGPRALFKVRIKIQLYGSIVIISGILASHAACFPGKRRLFLWTRAHSRRLPLYRHRWSPHPIHRSRSASTRRVTRTSDSSVFLPFPKFSDLGFLLRIFVCCVYVCYVCYIINLLNTQIVNRSMIFFCCPTKVFEYRNYRIYF